MKEMQETWVQSLGSEDPWEKEMTRHSSILAWETPGTEGPGGPQSMGLQRGTQLSHSTQHIKALSLPEPHPCSRQCGGALRGPGLK